MVLLSHEPLQIGEQPLSLKVLCPPLLWEKPLLTDLLSDSFSPSSQLAMASSRCQRDPGSAGNVNLRSEQPGW